MVNALSALSMSLERQGTGWNNPVDVEEPPEPDIWPARRDVFPGSDFGAAYGASIAASTEAAPCSAGDAESGPTKTL